MRKSHILFVYNNRARFVLTDLDILKERFTVREWYQEARKVRVLGLIEALRDTDLIFGWFASWHTFLPVRLAKRLNRPSIVVVGGYDTANLPEIGYGNQIGGIRRFLSKSVMHDATRLITNSNYIKTEAMREARIGESKIDVIHHGLEIRNALDTFEKKNLVITVGNVDTINLQRKGLEPFVRAAELLPNVQFVVIGRWLGVAIDRLRSLASRNVIFTGFLNDVDLENYYLRAKVYVQASQHEGFGLSVAEAMRSGCVPVVTKVGSLPEVVGESGVYVDSTEPNHLAEAIRHALSLDIEHANRARMRITQDFPMEKRRQNLYSSIESLITVS